MRQPGRFASVFGALGQIKNHKKSVGFAIGIILAIVVYFAMPDQLSAELRGVIDADGGPAYTSHGLKLTAAVAVLMATWWVTEAIPLFGTALLPLVIFPLVDNRTFAETAAPFASGTIFLFMGGFFLAASIQKWNLHKRIALVVVKLVGAKPKMIVLGFMIATGLVTMWVSNTATATMMLPIGLSVLHLVSGKKDSIEPSRSNFGKALMLGIAYSASTIATSSLISTPPNALLRAYLADNFGITLTFGKWLVFASPMAWTFLFIMWFILVNVLFPPEIEEIPGGHELIAKELGDLGPMSQGERRVGAVFVLAALSWLFLPAMFGNIGVTDEFVAMAIALILFLVPVKGEGRLLDAATAKAIPWDILLLFGGGLALSHAFTRNGLSAWIGELSEGIGGLPVVLVVLVITALVMALTELTSNTATAATFLPILGGVAAGIGHDVMLLVVPVALASTCAFMFPVATPPNAVAYSTGYLRMGDMIKAGLIFNLIGTVLITATTLVLGPIVLGISLG